MFKKLKDKITEDLKSSPQKFQQFTQSVTDKLQSSASYDENFFSIGDDDANSSVEAGFSSVSLMSPSDSRVRRNSNSSIASDVSFLPRYESSSMYHLQSDLDVSASELEDNASTSSSLGHLSKEQIYSAFQKSQMRYHKYRGRYTDLARHYKELERENSKMKSVLDKTQDKAIRRITELKEQCQLEQKAKAHLEGALRDELDEKQMKISSLETKIGLMQSGSSLIELGSGDKNEDMEKLTKYLNEARQEIESLNLKLQEYKANSIVFQSKEQEYKQKIANFEKELNQVSEREKENNLKLAQSKMELHNELLMKDTEIMNLKKDNEALKQSLEVVEKEDKANVNAKTEKLQLQNKKLIDKVESLTTKCNNLEAEVLKVEQFKFEIEKLNGVVAELKIVNQKCLDDSIKKASEEAELVQDLKEKTASLNQLKNEMFLSLEANEELQKRVDIMKKGLESCRINIKQLSEEKIKLVEKISTEKVDYEKAISGVREDAKLALLSLEKRVREKVQKEFDVKEEELREEFKNNLGKIVDDSSLQELQLTVMKKDEEIEGIKVQFDLLNEKLLEKVRIYKDLEKNHLELIEDSQLCRSKMNNMEKELAEYKTKALDYEEKVQRLQNNISTMQEESSYINSLLKEKDKELVELKKDSGNLERTNKEMVEKITILEKKQEVKNLENSECKILEMKVQKLEEEKQALMECIETERKTQQENMNKEILSKQEQISIVEEKCKLLEGDINNMKGILEEKERLCDKLKHEKNEANEDLIKLREEIKLLETKTESAQVEKCEIKILETKLEELQKERDELLDSFKKEKDFSEKLKIEKLDSEEKLAKLEEDTSYVSINLEESKKEICKLNQQLISESEKVEAVSAEYKIKLNELKKINKDLKEKLKDRDLQINSLSKKIEECSDVIKKQSEEFNNLLERSQQLDLITTKMQETNQETLKKEKEIQNNLTVKIEECEKNIMEKLDEIQKLKHNLEEIGKTCDSEREAFKKLNEENNELKKRIAELEAHEETVKMLGNEKEEIQNELMRLKVIEAEHKNLQLEKQKFEEKIEEIKQESSALLEEKEKLLFEASKLNQQLSETTHELQKQQSNNNKLLDEIEENKLRISQVTADNNHVAEENQKLLSELEEIKVNLEFLQNEKSHFNEERQRLIEDNEKLLEGLENFKKNLSLLEKQNEELNLSKLNNSNLNSYEDLQKDFYETKEKCDNVLIENKKMQMEIETLQEKCNNFDKVKKDYESQLSDLEHQVNELVHEKQLLQDEVQELKTSPLNIQNNSVNNKLDNLEIIKKEQGLTNETSNSNINSEKFLEEINTLRDKLTKYKSLDLTNKSSIEFYENELQKLKNNNEKLTRKLDETIVTLNHCSELSSSTEIEYLKNVLYNYMLGKESLVLARVIAAVCKFDPQQTETIIQKEQQKQTLLGQLGLL